MSVVRNTVINSFLKRDIYTEDIYSFKLFCGYSEKNTNLQNDIKTFEKIYPNICMMCCSSDTKQGYICNNCGYNNHLHFTMNNPFNLKYAYYLSFLAVSISNHRCNGCDNLLTLVWTKKKHIWIGYCVKCKKIR